MTQRDRDAAHDAAVGGGGPRIVRRAPRLERLHPPLDEPQRPLRGQADAPPIPFHPVQPALRHVVRIEFAALGERLGEQQRQRRVIVERGALGGWRQVPHALRKGVADRRGGTEPLGGHAELVADHQPQQ